jgi:lysine-ketoglutarate reductase/saccharopine dehydrogenase-like protein (TIGR00300 family)
MSTFKLPEFFPPDFDGPRLSEAPPVQFKEVEMDGVAPDGYHATSIYPEYFHVGRGKWVLPKQSRMDCVAVLEPDGAIGVREFRLLKAGDPVACGRRENGEDGIFVHTNAFGWEYPASEKFAFRTGISRETSFSYDYDELYNLLEYERENGFLLWVLGPAVAFDRDSRSSLAAIIDNGFAHGVLAGNALATHDIEAALFGTALGQDIYTKRHAHLSHYKHLDAINTIRRIGSIKAAVERGTVKDGIMASIIKRGVPFVLAGSIRDDGPMPEVIANSHDAQDAMRVLARKATTVIAMATQLHSIAVGNMTPSYTVTDDGTVRPVYFFTIDMSEFAANKLADRGSLTARSILTNTQDFVVNLHRRLIKKS